MLLDAVLLAFQRQPHMKFLENTGPLTKRKMTLSDPSTVTAEDGSVGTWTMIYDEGFPSLDQKDVSMSIFFVIQIHDVSESPLRFDAPSHIRGLIHHCAAYRTIGLSVMVNSVPPEFDDYSFRAQ